MLLEKEEEEHIQELVTREAMKECGYCKERDDKRKSFEVELEKEKVRECQKALEREKISKGIMGTRQDEYKLKEMQKIQMQQKKYMEQETEHIERMWHEVLLRDVRRKEERERLQEERRQKDMIERRHAYDEQIASANRKRQEALREEREKENIKLDKMKKKMEQDHYDAIKRKKEQQMVNKQNFIEGHQGKVSRIKEEKLKERILDNNSIAIAMEQLRQEKLKKIMDMRNMQIEKKVFTEHFNRERRIADELEREADTVAGEWKQIEEDKADEQYNVLENDKKMNKETAIQEYRNHIEERKQKLEKEKIERKVRMENVKRTAFTELQRRLDNANNELRKQVDYRNSLTAQIRDNQRFMENEIKDFHSKERPFNKKAEMFKDVMNNKYRMSSARNSTNPIHPFKWLIDTEEAKTVQLPSIRKG